MDANPPLRQISRIGPTEHDNDDIINDEASRMKAVGMETLFLMVVGNNIPHLLEWLLLFIEDLQISSGAFPHSGDHSAEGFPLPLWHGYLLNPLAPKSHETFESYNQAFVWCCAGLFVWIINGAYVAHTIYRGRYVVMPLVTFRLLSAIFPSFLFIPLVEMLLSALDCAWTSDWRLHIVEKDVVHCLSEQHLPVFMFAILFLCVFVPLSTFLAFNFVAIDPTYKAPSSRVHGRCDGIYAMLKVFLFIFLRIWTDILIITLGAVIFVAVLMLYLIDYYRPHYDPKVNYFRSATFTSTVVFAVLIGLLKTGNVTNQNIAVGIVLPCCIASWLIGFKISAVRYRSRLARIPTRLTELESLTGLEQQNYLVFDSWPTVEISCRFITEPMTDRKRAFDENLAPLVFKIMNRGVVEFPHCAFVHLSYNLYSNVMQSVPNSRLYPLSATKALSPAFDVSFFVYMTERVELRLSQMSALGQHVELSVTEFAEFKKLEKDAKRNHKRAAQQLRLLWRVLAHSSIDTAAVSQVVSDMQEAMDEADKNYRRLLQLYPGSAAMNRAYASFLIEVKNEEEPAEEYIQEADYLEEKALSAHRRELGFVGSNHAPAEINLDDHPGDEAAVPSPFEPQTTNAELPAEPEGLRASPTLHLESWEREAFAPAAEDIEGSSAFIAVGEKRQLRRAESRSTDTSRRSATGNSARRTAIMTTMGLPAVRLLTILNMAAMGVSLITIGAQTFALVSLVPLFSAQEFAQSYRRVLRRNSRYVATIFQNLRRMRLAALTKDVVEFNFWRNRLRMTTSDLKSHVRAAFAGLRAEYAELYNLYTTPVVLERLRTFPTYKTVNGTTPLFGISENYAGKASVLLDRTVDDFAAPSMLTNNDFRFILDNFATLSAAHFHAQIAFPGIYFSEGSVVHIQVWASAALTTCVIVCCVAQIVERWFRKMEKQHLPRLELLDRIPKAIRMAIRDTFDSSDDDTTHSPVADIASTSSRLNSHREFRLRGSVFALCVSLLAFLYAYFGTSSLTSMAIIYSALEPIGQLRNKAVLLESLITEMEVSDIPETWPDTLTIEAQYKENLKNYTSAITEMIYPSNGNFSITDAPPIIQALWFDPSCLPINTTVCDYPDYDESIGFTASVVNNGLGVLVFESADAGSKVASILNGTKLDANYPPARFFVAANRDHLSDGLSRLTTINQNLFFDYVRESLHIFYGIYVGELMATFLGYVVLFRAMGNWYRKKDRATSMMFFKLPQNAIRSDKLLQSYLETGILNEEANAPLVKRGANSDAGIPDTDDGATVGEQARAAGWTGALMRVFAPKTEEKPHVLVSSLERRRRSAAHSSLSRRGSPVQSLSLDHRGSLALSSSLDRKGSVALSSLDRKGTHGKSGQSLIGNKDNIIRSGNLTEENDDELADDDQKRRAAQSSPSVLLSIVEDLPPQEDVDENNNSGTKENGGQGSGQGENA